MCIRDSKPTVVALREIAEGHISESILLEKDHPIEIIESDDSRDL